MIGLDLDTWISLAVLVTALTGFHVALRRELHTEISGLRGEMGGLRTEVRDEMGGLRTEVRDEMGGLRTEVRDEMGGLRTELRDEMGGLRTELRDEMGGLRGEMAVLRVELKADINRLDERVYALASGMRPLLEKADRPAST
ncbi:MULTISPECIES: hypothetical protein [unclassified Nocardioides]|uniref:hypothetical protein n=1 Tax=unclassified Nocardioides TaxID=2615069 RepID=UPI0006FC96EF|nr:MULTISPECIES: hypothetical protein [unclassified Nocardioides]KRA31193.1 hypothetical protein ASD81_17135 [Nocardioides sp. Root614]KRA87813.1 hypothetical protein ASD84_17405 [Nocardioides sp. Root682]